MAHYSKTKYFSQPSHLKPWAVKMNLNSRERDGSKREINGKKGRSGGWGGWKIANIWLAKRERQRYPTVTKENARQLSSSSQVIVSWLGCLLPQSYSKYRMHFRGGLSYWSMEYKKNSHSEMRSQRMRDFIISALKPMTVDYCPMSTESFTKSQFYHSKLSPEPITYKALMWHFYMLQDTFQS